MTYVIALPCVDLKDKACIDECPVDCIYEGERMLYIHPDECVDCGACEPVCPVEAIYYEDDVPEQWADYYNANVEFFDDLGSPGGAAKLGRDRQGPPAHRGRCRRRNTTSEQVPRAPGVDSACPTSPGTPSRPTRRERPRIRTGIVDLSVGTPVDPTPPVVAAGAGRGRRRARLPADRGARPTLREAICAWFARRRGVPDLEPRRRPADHRQQGARGLAADAARPRPGRPRRHPGHRLPDLRRRGAARRRHVVVAQALDAPRAADPVDHPEAVVAQQPRQPHWAGSRRRAPGARSSPGRGEHGVLVASDECYAELDWRDGPGRHERRRASCTPTSAAATTRGCSPSTRCPSSPTSPATGPPSSPATRSSSPGSSRCASTPG